MKHFVCGLILMFVTLGHTTLAVTDWKSLQFGQPTGDAQSISPPGDNRWEIAGSGRDAYLGKDEGTFIFVETEADTFRLTVRLAVPPSGLARFNTGVMVRESLLPGAKSVSLRHDNYEKHQCLQWFARFRAADVTTGHQLCYRDGILPEYRKPEGRWFRIERHYPSIEFYTSSDGTHWDLAPSDYYLALQARKVAAGYFLTAGDPGQSSVSAVFDSVTFEPGPEKPLKNRYAEYRRVDPVEPCLIRVNAQTFEVIERMKKWEGKTPEGTCSLIFLRPQGITRPKALLYTSGNKEFASADDPNTQFWTSLGVARIGGYFQPELTSKAFAALERETGIPGLGNTPFVVTGGSFAGGYTGKVAWLFPEKTIAAAPLTLGIPLQRQFKSGERRFFDVPILSVYGSHDGGQMDEALKLHPEISANRALYAHAPLWWVKHANTDAYTLVRSYFQEMIRTRVPENPDYTRGPVTLRPLDYQRGWYGDISTWKTAYPRIAPVEGFNGDLANTVWLPSERLARIWQSFVSFAPRTVILWPFSEGEEWEGAGKGYNCMLEAHQPFDILAMGPTGPGLDVQYFADDRPLKIIEGSQYRVTVEGLDSGWHAIYATTTLAGTKEISRPAGILFQERRRP